MRDALLDDPNGAAGLMTSATSSTYIAPLHGEVLSADCVGGRAHNLIRLCAAGMPVPDGFVITTAAYRAYRERGQMVYAIAEQIAAAYEVLGTAVPVAVRPSATAEDLRGASFAGGQDTILNVTGRDAVIAAVQKCWDSLQSERVRAYRGHMGIAEAGLAMAVVVQRMVNARASGVVFTVEPVSGDAGTLALDACPGLGESLVSGHMTPEHFEFRRRDLSITKHDNRAAYLSRKDAHAIAMRALEIEQHFDGPQDIEWSIDGNGTLYFLQARPITTLSASGAWTSPVEGAIWVRRGGGGISEYLPTAVSPLYASAQLSRITRLHDAQCPEMGVLKPPPANAIINGHHYSRQDYRLGIRALLLPFNCWKAGRKAAHWWKHTVLPAQQARLAELQDFDRASASARALLARLERVLDFNARAWDNAVRASRGWVVLEPVFQRIFNWFIQPVTGGDAVAFLRGFSSHVLTAEREQYDLVLSALDDPDVAAVIRDCEPRADVTALQRTVAGREWLGKLFGFCERYGHLTPNQDYFCATAADDPVKAVQNIRLRLDMPAVDAFQRHRKIAEARVEEERAAREKLAHHPLRRALFNWALAWAQEGAAIREDVFFHALAGWPLARRIIVELGTRFAARAYIPTPEHVFFLEWHELCALARGEASFEYDPVVRYRRAAFDQQSQMTPPPVIPIGGPPSTVLRRILAFLRRLVIGSVREDRDGWLRGSPASPGRVTGPARILSSTGDAARLQAGDIVVTRAATPEWTPAFTVAAGLVTDTGGPLSHCSIIAREFGIPAVMGVQTATRRIKDGQVITVDGGKGVIRLHTVEARQ